MEHCILDRESESLQLHMFVKKPSFEEMCSYLDINPEDIIIPKEGDVRVVSHVNLSEKKRSKSTKNQIIHIEAEIICGLCGRTKHTFECICEVDC